MKLLFSALLLSSAFACNASITITGKVTDKNGQPVSKCDVFFNANAWIDDDSIHVQCDASGNYSAVIEPGLYNSVYVCDEELYGKSKLEFWGWNLTFNESQVLNAQFDTMEVYSLATWASNGGSNSMFASFRPMSLAKAKTPQHKQIQHNGKAIVLFDISPDIDAKSIQGFVDDSPLRLIDYSWTYEKVASCGNVSDKLDTSNGCYMPMIIAQFEKPVLTRGKHTIKIDLRDATTGDFGQGITHFTANAKGLGF